MDMSEFNFKITPPTDAELDAMMQNEKFQQLLSGIKEVTIEVAGQVEVCPCCGAMVGIEECFYRN